MKTIKLILSLVISTLSVCAQNNNGKENDSIQIFNIPETKDKTNGTNAISNVSTQEGASLNTSPNNNYNNISSDSIAKRLGIHVPPFYKGPMDNPNKIATTNVFENEYSYRAFYPVTSNSILSTHSFLHVYPGMGSINSISANYNYQPIDWLSMSLGTYISKYSLYMNTYNDIGTNANVKFHLNDRFRVNVFGQYSAFGKHNDIGGNVRGMYPQSLYGTSLEYKINEKFGVQGGVVRELDATSGKWVNRPFIAPVFYSK